MLQRGAAAGRCTTGIIRSEKVAGRKEIVSAPNSLKTAACHEMSTSLQLHIQTVQTGIQTVIQTVVKYIQTIQTVKDNQFLLVDLL